MNGRIRFILAAAACFAAITQQAAAVTWDGHVKTDQTADVESPADGILEQFSLEMGETVRAGTRIGQIRRTGFYAPADGTIEGIHLELRDDINGGVVLEIDPVAAYDVSGTADNTEANAKKAMVHSGETLYVRCTADGEHRASGRVTIIDGDSFHVEITEGELYIGETVRMFRDAEYSESTYVGSGTVNASSLIACSGQGKLLELLVEEGDKAERGQLLWRSASSEETKVTIPADGVICERLAEKGEQVAEDQVLARIAVSTLLSIPVPEEDVDLFERGKVFCYYRADDPHDTLRQATVSRILQNVGDAGVTVELTAAEGNMPIGLTVTLTDETD